VIESRTEASDGRGGRLPTTWSEHAKTYAAIEPMESTEELSQQGKATVGDYRIRTRYVVGVLASMRVRRISDDRKFEVLGVMNREERNREIWLECREDRRG